MQAFEYANPATVREAVGMLGARWGEVQVLALFDPLVRVRIAKSRILLVA